MNVAGAFSHVLDFVNCSGFLRDAFGTYAFVVYIKNAAMHLLMQGGVCYYLK